jgi:MOSC domain-containing protein YiiM
MTTLQHSVTSVAHRTPEELEAGLGRILAAPKVVGALELVVRRPAVDGREVVDRAELDLEHGLVGDDWERLGRSGGRPASTEAQITVTSARAIDLVAGTRDRWAQAGDQLYVDFDVSQENLPAGTRLAVGTAVLEVSEAPHTGCKKFAARFGLEAIRFFSTDEGLALNLRGINTRIVEPGAVRAGDAVRKL